MCLWNAFPADTIDLSKSFTTIKKSSARASDSQLHSKVRPRTYLHFSLLVCQHLHSVPKPRHLCVVSHCLYDDDDDDDDDDGVRPLQMMNPGTKMYELQRLQSFIVVKRSDFHVESEDGTYRRNWHHLIMLPEDRPEQGEQESIK